MVHTLQVNMEDEGDREGVYNEETCCSAPTHYKDFLCRAWSYLEEKFETKQEIQNFKKFAR